MRGRTVILAGGSGGLGGAMARQLSDEGARLVISYRDNEARAIAFDSIATLVQCDLCATEDRRKLRAAAPDVYGLVVFAGDPARVAKPDEFEDAAMTSHESNYFGPIMMARETADFMREVGTPGAIVLISSMQAVSPFPGSTAYAAQKAALIHGARILANECRGPANIRLNVVCPGVTKAGMAEVSVASGKYDRYLSEGAISRFGRAEDIARAVRFFLEPDNYVTGQVLTVDGGLTL
ncbi:MAG: SDR family oxidoreductase [Bryobacteraceae bacterium]